MNRGWRFGEPPAPRSTFLIRGLRPQTPYTLSRGGPCAPLPPTPRLRRARRSASGATAAAPVAHSLRSFASECRTVDAGAEVQSVARRRRGSTRLVRVARAREYQVPFQEIKRIADLEIGGLAGTSHFGTL